MTGLPNIVYLILNYFSCLNFFETQLERNSNHQSLKEELSRLSDERVRKDHVSYIYLIYIMLEFFQIRWPDLVQVVCYMLELW